MVKCHKCGTGWTSKGLPLCPVCGTRIDEPAQAAKPAAAAARVPLAAVSETPGANVELRSAVLEAPGGTPRIQLEKVEPGPSALPPKIAEPAAKPPAEPRREPANRRLEAEPFAPTVEFRECAPQAEPPPEAPKPDFRDLERIPRADPSALSLPVIRELRTTSRPLSGPLILGALAYVGVFLFPLTVAFESNRVLGILGFCMTAFFAPFAPIAWTAGLLAEKRRRDQGLRPENPVSLGRLLGQWATLLLVSEVTLALIGIAALRLAGRFPFSFWTPFY
jgi:hypothetical protein